MCAYISMHTLSTVLTSDYEFSQGLNIIFLDAPAGTGFSYSTTQEGYYVDEYIYAAQGYEFLQKVYLSKLVFNKM